MKKVSDPTEMNPEKDQKKEKEGQSSQKDGLKIKESMKEIVKRKLKKVHEEIIAPPGQ
ncbi:MAG: hypothetical protein ACE144_05405 [Thermodesulfobacteriota bacterium]